MLGSIKRPSEELTKKYALALDHDKRLGGKLSHIVVMQHVTKERLQEFVDDLDDYISLITLKQKKKK